MSPAITPARAPADHLHRLAAAARKFADLIDAAASELEAAAHGQAASPAGDGGDLAESAPLVRRQAARKQSRRR